MPQLLIRDPRVRLAAERTLLAWVRTGVALMGFGFVVARFGWLLRVAAGPTVAPPATGFSLTVGVVLVMLGTIVPVLGGLEYRQFLRRYSAGEDDPVPTWSPALVVAGILTAVGLATAVNLLGAD